MTISEKVAYLKGLAEGLNLDVEKSKEGKLISVIIGILEDIGLSLEDLENSQNTLEEALDAVSDDLEDVENVVFDELEDDEDEEEDDDDFFEIECPNCEAKLIIDEDVLAAGEITCPSCEQKFELDLADDEACGEGCGCGEED